MHKQAKASEMRDSIIKTFCRKLFWKISISLECNFFLIWNTEKLSSCQDWLINNQPPPPPKKKRNKNSGEIKLFRTHTIEAMAAVKTDASFDSEVQFRIKVPSNFRSKKIEGNFNSSLNAFICTCDPQFDCPLSVLWISHMEIAVC